MIYTITINPAIDQHIVINRLIKDDAIRAQHTQRDPGGNGINVSRVIKELGGQTRAFAVVGGCAGYMMRDLLDRNRLDFSFIEVIGETRINVIVTDIFDKTQTRISMQGPEVDPDIIDALIEMIDQASPRPSFWVLGGSLPPGAPVDIYQKIIKHLKGMNEKCIFDADGQALRLGIKASPFLIKPNEFELERISGKPMKNDSAVVEASMQICKRGVSIVVASLGERGAIAVTKDQAFKYEFPKVEIRSKVGAGDSLIGAVAFALEKGFDFKDAVSYGVAAGTAAVITEGTRLCLRDDVQRLKDKIRVTTMDIQDKIEVKDIVCGMDIHKAMASAKTNYNGEDYYFCSIACKKRFAVDPENFTKRKIMGG